MLSTLQLLALSLLVKSSSFSTGRGWTSFYIGCYIGEDAM
jgi:hypothetical protein